MKINKSYIFLKGIRFYAYHGVAPQENLIGNEYIIDLKLGVDISKAMQTDEVTDTVNYAEVYNVIKTEMDISSKLLEHVGKRMLDALYAAFPQLQYAKIKISKMNPPLGGQIRCTSVTLEK